MGDHIKLFEQYSKDLDIIIKKIVSEIYDMSDCDDRPRDTTISDICDDLIYNLELFIDENNIKTKINKKELVNHLKNVVFKGGIRKNSDPNFLKNQWWTTKKRTPILNFPYVDKETFDEIKSIISKNS